MSAWRSCRSRTPGRPPPPERLSAPPRILVLSAGIGEGHDLPARALRDGIAAERPEAIVEIVDALAEAPRFVRSIVGQEAPLQRSWLNWWFDVEYRVLIGWRPMRRVVSRLGTLLAGPAVVRIVERFGPDVVVSTYPGTSEILGRLRERGRVRVPVCSAITDLAALWLWAHPAIDLHLITHAESAAEVRAIAPASRIVCARGMTNAAFERPLGEAAARAALGLPASGGVVLVSGGGWGVGDVAGAIEAALAVPGVDDVVALCGRSDALARRLAARFGSDARVRVLGFTERMSELMAAADALVHSTAGLTVLEAWIRGCRPVSYGWGVAHIRVNNEAYERSGLADVARDRAELRAALARALAAPRRPHPEYGALTSAAAEILALAERAPPP